MTELLLHASSEWAAYGWAGLLAMAGLFAIGSMAFIPRPALCAAGGFVFGMTAFPVALVASTAGATAAMLIGRRLLRPIAGPAILKRRIPSAVVSAVNAEGWRLIALIRLGSPLPATPVNYMFGLTTVGTWAFAGATALGSALPVLCLTYLGSLGRTALHHEAVSYGQACLLVVAIVSTLLVTVLISRRTGRILFGPVQQGSPSS